MRVDSELCVRRLSCDCRQGDCRTHLTLRNACCLGDQRGNLSSTSRTVFVQVREEFRLAGGKAKSLGSRCLESIAVKMTKWTFENKGTPSACGIDGARLRNPRRRRVLRWRVFGAEGRSSSRFEGESSRLQETVKLCLNPSD